MGEPEYITYVIDAPEELLGGHWEHLLAVSDADTLLYAAFAYLMYYDVYYMESIAETLPDDDPEMELEVRELLGMWIDDVYMALNGIAEELIDGKGYNLAACRFGRHDNSIAVILKAREFDEPFTSVKLEDFKRPGRNPRSDHLVDGVERTRGIHQQRDFL